MKIAALQLLKSVFSVCVFSFWRECLHWKFPSSWHRCLLSWLRHFNILA